MTEEELLLRFHAAYPGVYLSVQHNVRKLRDNPLVHEWSFWHGGAGESIGEFPTALALSQAVLAWERSGEMAAACELRAFEESARLRRERLTKDRLDAERKAVHDADQPYTPPLVVRLNATAAKVADPSYVPTVEEAARRPKEFVEGMKEIDDSGIDLSPPEYGIPVGYMRPGFQSIVSGWMLCSGLGGLTERIEAAAEWTKANGPLQPDEEATIKLMIESQIARSDEDEMGMCEDCAAE